MQGCITRNIRIKISGYETRRLNTQNLAANVDATLSAQNGTWLDDHHSASSKTVGDPGCRYTSLNSDVKPVLSISQ